MTSTTQTSSAVQLLLGVPLAVAGLVLALAYPDAELGWFEGRPLGILLAVLGVVYTGGALLRRRPGGR
jgi:1,4-dihydroxy-2-naphthoate octaprenyltransferase